MTYAPPTRMPRNDIGAPAGVEGGHETGNARDGMTRLREVEKEALAYVVDICHNNGFRYFILGGTVLGAVRHKGYIPWDDDIDIGVPREEYDKLLEILRADCDKRFKLVHYEDNTDGAKRFFMQLESTSVKLVMKGQNRHAVRGVWIDIFPLDGMPNGRIARAIRCWRIMFLRALGQLSQFDEVVNLKKAGRPFIERVIIFLGDKFGLCRNLDTVKIYRRLEKILGKSNYDGSEYVINAMGAYKLREMVPSAWIGQGKTYSFEGMKLNGPVDSDSYLKRLYGDYMTLPPEDQRNWHQIELLEGQEDERYTESSS